MRDMSGTCKILGRRRAVNEDAVHAVTKSDHFFERLDVNVARTLLDGLDDDEVGQLDDGRFLGRSGKLIDVHLLDDFLDRLQPIRLIRRLLFGVLDDVFHRPGLGPFDLVQLVRDGPLRGDHRHNLKLGDPLDVVDGENV